MQFKYKARAKKSHKHMTETKESASAFCSRGFYEVMVTEGSERNEAVLHGKRTEIGAFIPKSFLPLNPATVDEKLERAKILNTSAAFETLRTSDFGDLFCTRMDDCLQVSLF